MGTVKMVTSADASVTLLLQQWRTNPDDRAAADRFAAAVYAELHRLAAARLRGESGTTFSATELVNELWLGLDVTALRGENRSQFFCVAALAMRHLLVDRARERLAQKRGAGAVALSLRWAEQEATFDDTRLIDLDAALEGLRRNHPRHADVVQLRCFGGLELAEIAAALEVSLATVKRDWAFASAWLADAMRESA